jgi:hypothetical protein
MADVRAWHFEPLGPTLCPIGESPFRVRGLAYVSVLDYVRRKTPGGFAAVETPSPAIRSWRTSTSCSSPSEITTPCRSALVRAGGRSNASRSVISSSAGRVRLRARCHRNLSPAAPGQPLAQLIERLLLTFNRY